MINLKSKNEARVKRHQRIRNRINGTADRPRLCVFRSNKNIEAQIINDLEGKTLVATGSLSLKLENGGNVDAAKLVGKDIAEKALKAGIKTVVFDRSGYIYHGRVKALAEAAREAGLVF